MLPMQTKRTRFGEGFIDGTFVGRGKASKEKVRSFRPLVPETAEPARKREEGEDRQQQVDAPDFPCRMPIQFPRGGQHSGAFPENSKGLPVPPSPTLQFPGKVDFLPGVDAFRKAADVHKRIPAAEEEAPGGKVQAHGEIWNAESDDDIKKGDRVIVENVDGMLVHVKKLS